jgi:hypothetical protein
VALLRTALALARPADNLSSARELRESIGAALRALPQARGATEFTASTHALRFVRSPEGGLLLQGSLHLHRLLDDAALTQVLSNALVSGAHFSANVLVEPTSGQLLFTEEFAAPDLDELTLGCERLLNQMDVWVVLLSSSLQSTRRLGSMSQPGAKGAAGTQGAPRSSILLHTAARTAHRNL